MSIIERAKQLAQLWDMTLTPDDSMAMWSEENPQGFHDPDTDQWLAGLAKHLR
jgi:hypothetical protein